jgi:hypothetical protein
MGGKGWVKWLQTGSQTDASIVTCECGDPRSDQGLRRGGPPGAGPM